MDIGLCSNEMLNAQFPKMIWEVSSKVDDLERSYRIRDKVALDGDRALMDQVFKLNEEVDVMRWLPSDGWFVNEGGYEGTPIDSERISKYYLAIQGKFGSCMDHRKRREFFEAADGLHFVKVGSCIDGILDHLCECVDFYKKTACPHSYILKYGKPVLVDAKHTKKTKIEESEIKEYKKKTKMMYDWADSGFD